MIKPSCKYLGRLDYKISCQKLETFCQLFCAKVSIKRKTWQELLECFSHCTLESLYLFWLHGFTFASVSDGIIEQQVRCGTLKVLQWKSHPWSLMYVRSKSKVIQNIFNLQEWHQNMKITNLFTTYSLEYLFTLRGSLWEKKN